MSNTPTHGSDVQETPDWWKASDGRFYPPELHPNYVKPADPAPSAAEPDASPVTTDPPLAERLRAEADRVGDEASAAADAGVGSMDSASLIDDAKASVRSTIDDGTNEIADAGDGLGSQLDGAASGVVPDVGSVDPRATVVSTSVPSLPITPPVIPPAPVTTPTVPPLPATPPMPSPGAPPAMPSSFEAPSAPGAVPPSPGAPPMPAPSMPSPDAPPAMPPAPAGAPVAPANPPTSMPPAPGAPPVQQGPGGITYTPAPDARQTFPDNSTPAPSPQPAFGQPAEPAIPAASTKKASTIAGVVAGLGGIAAIAGGLLGWGSVRGLILNDAGEQTRDPIALADIAGFDSSGIFGVAGGAVLLICALLFFMGIPKQLTWGIGALLAGAVIVGAVIFSFIDINGLPDAYRAQLVAIGNGDGITNVEATQGIGLWLAGAGGVLGVLAAPFANRN